MSERMPVDDLIRAWLEGPAPVHMAPDRVDAALAEARDVRQRRGWRALPAGLRPWPSSTPLGRVDRRLVWLLVLAALLGILVMTALIAGGSRRRLPPPFGPAANGLIAYAAGGDLFLADVTTASSTMLLEEELDVAEPAFSPDGQRIAFYRSTVTPQLEDIVVVNADGSGERDVTPAPVLSANWFDWPPDGRILWVVSVVDGRTALQRLDLAGPPHAETLVTGVDLDEPAIRPPDGGEVLYRWRRDDMVGLSAIEADGRVRDVVPGRWSANPDYDLRAPRWSPDGTRIAVQRWSDGRMRVEILDAAGALVRRLQSDPGAAYEGWPAWSPDGTRVVLERLYGSADAASYAVVPVDGGQAVPTGPGVSGPGERADWSPDGTKLLFKNDDGVRLLLDAAGGPAVRLPWSSPSYPAWQRVAPP